jgi:hypothetical protein
MYNDRMVTPEEASQWSKSLTEMGKLHFKDLCIDSRINCVPLSSILTTGIKFSDQGADGTRRESPLKELPPIRVFVFVINFSTNR